MKAKGLIVRGESISQFIHNIRGSKNGIFSPKDNFVRIRQIFIKEKMVLFSANWAEIYIMVRLM